MTALQKSDGQTGHTAGPWEAEYGADGYFYVTHDDGLELRGDANARLIAAAPELFAIVKAVDHMWSDDGEGGRNDPIHARSGKVREIWQQMRAAIAKATGAAA